MMQRWDGMGCSSREQAEEEGTPPQGHAGESVHHTVRPASVVPAGSAEERAQQAAAAGGAERIDWGRCVDGPSSKRTSMFAGAIAAWFLPAAATNCCCCWSCCSSPGGGYVDVGAQQSRSLRNIFATHAFQEPLCFGACCCGAAGFITNVKVPV